MKGITFGSYHSYDSWGLILSHSTVESPEPKVSKVDILGGDGELDFTEFFGDVKYRNRKMQFVFSLPKITPSSLMTKMSEIQDVLHGRVFEITLDSDLAYYYVGRVTVPDYKLNKRIGEITVDVDAKPYKLSKVATSVTQAVTEGVDIVLKNSRMSVVPEITTDADMQFIFDGNTYSANAGTFKIPQIQLKQGQNPIRVSGNGNVTFEYREGRL